VNEETKLPAKPLISFCVTVTINGDVEAESAEAAEDRARNLFGTTAIENEGWYIDDVEVQELGN